MKNLFKLLIGVVAMAACFYSCDKDDDDSSPKSSFKFDGKTYELSQGFLENYGGYDGTYNLDLILLSSGIKFYELNGVVDSVSGIGDFVYFEIFTSNSTSLSTGDYVFNTTQDQGTFDIADIGINYNTRTESGTYLTASSGKLKVIKNSPAYEISFDLTIEGGKKITGFYKGSLKYYDLTDFMGRYNVVQDRTIVNKNLN